MIEAKTICVECKYYWNEDTERDSIHSKFCTHPDTLRDKYQDPVSGKEGYVGMNSLGAAYFTTKPYPVCYLLNNGNCPNFREK